MRLTVHPSSGNARAVVMTTLFAHGVQGVHEDGDLIVVAKSAGTVVQPEDDPHGVPLVDHWEHWEWATTQVGHTESWIDAATHTPDEQGHRQLAKRLIQDLKLNDIPKPEFPVSVEESVLQEE